MHIKSKSHFWYPTMIIIGFPIIYMLYSSSGVAVGLFDDNNLDYYIPFWGGIVILHWLSVYCVASNLKQRDMRFADIGLTLSAPRIYYLILGYFLIAVIAVLAVEYFLGQKNIEPGMLERLPGLVPISTAQRIFFIFLVFSTGVCEEIVYRGFAITSMEQNGVNKWVALLIAAFIFVGIHGFYAYFNRFVFLFGGGLMFGLIYLLSKRLLPGIVIHLVINLSAMFAILSIQSD